MPSVETGLLYNAYTLAATNNTDWLDMQAHLHCSLQMVTTAGDSVGTLKVQVSNDLTNWADVAFLNEATGGVVTSIAVASGANNLALSLSNMTFRAVRLSYTKSSGTTSVATCSTMRKQK